MRKVYLSVLIMLMTGCAMAVSLSQWSVVNTMLQTGSAQPQQIPDLTANLSSEQLEKERNLARWYNYQLYREMAGEEAYENLLNFGGGRMGYLELPGKVYPIVHGNSGEPDAAVHCVGTPLPIGGRGTCSVLRCKTANLSEGEQFRVHILGTVLIYQVTALEKTLPGMTEDDLCVLEHSSVVEPIYIIAKRLESAEQVN